MRNLVTALVFIFLFLLTLIFFANAVNAADVKLRWDKSVDATGYKIYASFDGGITWPYELDVNNVVVFIVPDVPEDKLVLFRVSAYDANSEAISTWQGAWFDGTKRPTSPPKGLGAK